MVGIASLWLAILFSAVIVWFASALIWMVLPHHKADYKALPDEDAARTALQPQSLAPGQYNIPHLTSMKEMKLPEAQQKFAEGPVAFITVLPNGAPPMGRNMAISFVFTSLSVSSSLTWQVARWRRARTT